MMIRLLDFNTQLQTKTAIFQVQMYGIDKQGQSVSILMNDFRPFFLLWETIIGMKMRLPRSWNLSIHILEKKYWENTGNVS